MLYAVEIRRKFDIKEKTTRDGREVLGGSSAKSCQCERNPKDCMVEVVEKEIDFYETGRQEEEGQEIGEFESDVSSYSGDLNISLLSCDSSEKVSASQKKRDEIPTPPTGWFCSLIIVWALLGPVYRCRRKQLGSRKFSWETDNFGWHQRDSSHFSIW